MPNVQCFVYDEFDFLVTTTHVNHLIQTNVPFSQFDYRSTTNVGVWGPKKKKKKKKKLGPSISEPALRAPPPMPAEVRARAEAAKLGDTQPMPFMSPYETTAKVSKGIFTSF